MMKKFYSILFISLVYTLTSQAQTKQDIFNPGILVTWFGIDYSHSKIIGSINQFGGKVPVTAIELRDTYYPSWNNLVLEEPEKFNVAKMIARKAVANDITMVAALNAAVNLDSLEIKETPIYTREKIQEFVSAYPIEGKSGIGLVFIAESLSKPYAGAYYHVVFFKMDTKEIILQERMQGLASGAGLRNYWGGSIFNTMEYVRGDRFPSWRKRYLTK